MPKPCEYRIITESNIEGILTLSPSMATFHSESNHQTQTFKLISVTVSYNHRTGFIRFTFPSNQEKPRFLFRVLRVLNENKSAIWSSDTSNSSNISHLHQTCQHFIMTIPKYYQKKENFDEVCRQQINQQSDDFEDQIEYTTCFDAPYNVHPSTIAPERAVLHKNALKFCDDQQSSWIRIHIASHISDHEPVLYEIFYTTNMKDYQKGLNKCFKRFSSFEALNSSITMMLSSPNNASDQNSSTTTPSNQLSSSQIASNQVLTNQISSIQIPPLPGKFISNDPIELSRRQKYLNNWLNVLVTDSKIRESEELRQFLTSDDETAAKQSSWLFNIAKSATIFGSRILGSTATVESHVYTDIDPKKPFVDAFRLVFGSKSVNSSVFMNHIYGFQLKSFLLQDEIYKDQQILKDELKQDVNEDINQSSNQASHSTKSINIVFYECVSPSIFISPQFGHVASYICHPDQYHTASYPSGVQIDVVDFSVDNQPSPHLLHSAFHTLGHEETLKRYALESNYKYLKFRTVIVNEAVLDPKRVEFDTCRNSIQIEVESWNELIPTTDTLYEPQEAQNEQHIPFFSCLEEFSSVYRIANSKLFCVDQNTLKIANIGLKLLEIFEIWSRNTESYSMVRKSMEKWFNAAKLETEENQDLIEELQSENTGTKILNLYYILSRIIASGHTNLPFVRDVVSVAVFVPPSLLESDSTSGLCTKISESFDSYESLTIKGYILAANMNESDSSVKDCLLDLVHKSKFVDQILAQRILHQS